MPVRRATLAIIILLGAPIFLFGGLDRFVGTWNATGRGLTKMQISVSGKQVRLHAFGSCHPQDCDWGEVDAQAYAPSVGANLLETAKAVTAQYETGFSRTIIAIFPGDTVDDLRVDMFTVFTDGSGRSPYHATILMRRGG
jgi:hypothetical protein